MGRKIKVLVIDDSMLFREVMAKGLNADSAIEVVAKAEDPFDAIDKIEHYLPDILICDVNMPKMNGIEFIRQLLPQHPVPIIVVSSASGVVFDAMNAGAVDFVSKPDMKSPNALEVFLQDMIAKVKTCWKAKVVVGAAGGQRPQDASANGGASGTGIGGQEKAFPGTRLIAIGASTGGTEAIYKVLSRLPANLPGIVIVQHIPPMFSKMFADRLNNQTAFEVMEARNNDLIQPGRVLVAPGDQHVRIKRVGDQLRVECFSGERVNGHCPSVDVMMLSAAEAVGEKSVGVILTGMGYDGAKGLLAMKRKGARTIVQDEASSVVYGMPKVAYDIGAAGRQVSLDQIHQAILAQVR